MATPGRRVPVHVLVLLVFPFNYIFIAVVPANYTAWAHAFDSAIWALKLLMSSNREFKGSNPSIPGHYSECWANMVLLSPRWMIKVVQCLYNMISAS